MELIDLEALYQKYLINCSRFSTYNDCLTAYSMAETLPRIDASPVVHCRWIPKYQPPDPKASWSTEYYCSGCGHETHMTVMPDQRDNYIDDYCGGCGARMDAEDINVLTKDGGAENADD